MLVAVAMAAAPDRERYQEAARDRDPDNAREKQCERDTPKSSRHVRSSSHRLTPPPPAIFMM
jgi:hypothetical protein